jgi:hypothetical protein
MNINLTTPFRNLLSRSDIPSDLLEIFFQIESITFSGRKYTTVYMNNEHGNIKEIGRKHFLIMNLLNRKDVSNDVKDLFNNVYIIKFLDESHIRCSVSLSVFHNYNLNFVKGHELYPLFDKDVGHPCNYEFSSYDYDFNWMYECKKNFFSFKTDEIYKKSLECLKNNHSNRENKTVHANELMEEIFNYYIKGGDRYYEKNYIIIPLELCEKLFEVSIKDNREHYSKFGIKICFSHEHISAIIDGYDYEIELDFPIDFDDIEQQIKDIALYCIEKKTYKDISDYIVPFL